MTIQEILKLPTEDLTALSDKDLAALLGPLIPEARREDKESAAARDMNQIIKQAQALLGQK